MKLCCSPADCVLALAIPHDYATFTGQLRTPSRHDFVPSQYRSWQKYRAEIVTTLDDVVPRVEGTGARVVHSVTFDGFAQLFPVYRVVILFAHWRDADDYVEFEDDLYPPDRVASVVPALYDGVVDLCVCHPAPLAKAVKRAAPNATVKFSWRRAQPRVWLYLYSVLFVMLQSESMPYGDALVRAIAAVTGS